MNEIALRRLFPRGAATWEQIQCATYSIFFIGDERLFDDDGSVHQDLASARSEAIRAARELMGDRLKGGEALDTDGSVEIVDEAGHLHDLLPLDNILLAGAPISRHRRVYDAVDQKYLLPTPDFTILEANRAYLNATSTELNSISGRLMFDVFPNNPNDPEASGVRNLSASLHRVLSNRVKDLMPAQRYDLRLPDGNWQKRYCKIDNTPALDGDGNVEFIIHHIE